MSKPLTAFTDASTDVVHDRPRPDRLVAGNPLRATWNHYEHAGVSAGRWCCEPGVWRIAFDPDKDEFFHVIAGRIRITDDTGVSREFGPGEACVIPGGFTGTFEVVEAVTKHYVLVTRSQIGS